MRSRYERAALRFPTLLERRAQRRCIPGRSAVACFQSPRRSWCLPGWILWAGLWSKQQYRLWVLPASGTGGLCSSGLSLWAATVRSKKQTVDNTFQHTHEITSTQTKSIYLCFLFLIAELNTLIARSGRLQKRSVTYFIFSSKRYESNRLCGFPAT